MALILLPLTAAPSLSSKIDQGHWAACPLQEIIRAEKQSEIGSGKCDKISPEPIGADYLL